MCPVCGKQSEFPNEKFDEVFSPNFYILGVILWSKPQGNQIMFVEAQTTSKNKKIVPGEQSADAPEPEGGKRDIFLITNFESIKYSIFVLSTFFVDVFFSISWFFISK